MIFFKKKEEEGEAAYSLCKASVTRFSGTQSAPQRAHTHTKAHGRGVWRRGLTGGGESVCVCVPVVGGGDSLLRTSPLLLSPAAESLFRGSHRREAAETKGPGFLFFFVEGDVWR